MVPTWTASFHFGDDRPRTARFLEWSKLGPQCILGADWMRTQGIRVDFSRDGPASLWFSQGREEADSLDVELACMELVELLLLDTCDSCEGIPRGDRKPG